MGTIKEKMSEPCTEPGWTVASHLNPTAQGNLDGSGINLGFFFGGGGGRVGIFTPWEEVVGRLGGGGGGKFIGLGGNFTAKLAPALCQWECVGGFKSSPENPSPSQSPGLLTCCRAKFLGNVLDSKVDSLIQDHSSQVEYLHLIKQGRRNGAAVTEERSKEALGPRGKEGHHSMHPAMNINFTLNITQPVDP